MGLMMRKTINLRETPISMKKLKVTISRRTISKIKKIIRLEMNRREVILSLSREI